MARQTDIIKPHAPPKRGVSTPRHSVAQLVRNSWGSRRKSAKRVAVKSVKVVNLPKNSLFNPETKAYRVVTYSRDNAHRHLVTVFVPDGEFSARSKVLVDCSCADHVYTFEYVLARRGNALMWRCNGETPDARNPGRKLGCCKHSITALIVMNRRAKSGKLVRSTRSKSKLSWRNGT